MIRLDIKHRGTPTTFVGSVSSSRNRGAYTFKFSILQDALTPLALEYETQKSASESRGQLVMSGAFPITDEKTFDAIVTALNRAYVQGREHEKASLIPVSEEEQ